MKSKSDLPLDRPPTVLVVDDEPLTRQIERRTLELEDRYNVIEAAGGAEGIAMLQDGRALDPLVADLDMPDVPGEEMVRPPRGRITSFIRIAERRFPMSREPFAPAAARP